MVHKSSALAAGTGGGTGGGTVSDITSSGGTITVTNPNGPITNVDANLATSGMAGIVQPDNSTITISGGVISATTGGGGSVTSVSGVTANGFAFSIANPTTTPAITAKTTVTGILQGNGTAISAVGAGGIPTSLLSSSAITVDAGTGLTGGGSVALGSSITLGLLNTSVTVSGVSGVTGGGTVALGSAITLGMADSIANTLAGYNSSGVFSDVSIGSNLSLSGGVLNGTVGPAPVSSVFSRTGAVVADWNDYQFNLIGGTAAVSQGGTGQTSLTIHSVLLGEGAVTGVGFATTGIAARILIDQGIADPAFKVLTGDSSLLSTGAMVNTAVNAVAYPASPTTNTVPVVTGTNQVTYEAVPNAALANSAITIGAQTGLAGGGSVSLGSAITLSMGTSIANSLAGYNSSGVFSDVSIGSNLTLSGGTLVATGGSGAVSSVFGRTGAVVADWNDYQFNLIGGTASASQGGTGLATLTAHAVMLGEGVSAVSFATVGTAGRLLIDQGAVDPKFQIITGDSSLASTGAMTNLAVHGVTYPASPATNTVPVVTSSNVVTYEAVPNAALANSAITIGAQTGLAGGGSVALGSAITLSMGTSVANTLAGYNSSGVFSDVSIGTNLNLVSGILATSAFSQGSGMTITYSSNTIGLSASGVSAGVASVSNTDGGSLTITPQAGNVSANLNTAYANSWTATQTSGVSGGATSLISAGSIEFSIFANGNSGTGNPSLKWANGNIQSVTISGACTLGFTLPANGGRLTVVASQSAGTGFSYNYPSTVLWPSGTVPTLSSASGGIDITSFLYDTVNVYGIANTAFAT